MFGGPPPDAQIVRPAVPSPEVLRVAKRLPKNLHMGTSSLSFPGWAGIVYAEQYKVSVLGHNKQHAYARRPRRGARGGGGAGGGPPGGGGRARRAARGPED